jgi:hypothetical protein
MSFLVTVQFCVSIVRLSTACETACKVSGPRKECLVNFGKGEWGLEVTYLGAWILIFCFGDAKVGSAGVGCLWESVC